MSRGGQSFRVQIDADKALSFAFAARPVFRMGFDHHVKRWRSAMQSDLWRLYCADPVFAARYDACVQAGRMVPMPEWNQERMIERAVK